MTYLKNMMARPCAYVSWQLLGKHNEIKLIIMIVKKNNEKKSKRKELH